MVFRPAVVYSPAGPNSRKRIIERLEGSGAAVGKRKVFRNDTVLKVFDELEFFNGQLSELGVGGDALSAAMRRIAAVVKGQNRDTLPESLRRGSEDYRTHVRDKFAKIAKQVAGKAVPEERRKLLRKKMSSTALSGK